MSTRIFELERKQSEIEDFFKKVENNYVTGTVLRQGIISAVVHFVDLGMSETILKQFLESTAFGESDSMMGSHHGIFEFSIMNSGYSLRSFLKNGRDNPKVIPLKTAISVARMLVSKQSENSRLVPVSLINALSNDRSRTLKTSLEQIESRYQDKDWQGMLSPLILATEQILSTVPDESLSQITNLKDKLYHFFLTKDLYVKYCAGNKDIIWGLNNSRIIRNITEHKTNEYLIHTIEISALEAVGYSHLLLLFINCLFASGVITRPGENITAT